MYLIYICVYTFFLCAERVAGWQIHKNLALPPPKLFTVSALYGIKALMFMGYKLDRFSY